MIDVLDHLTPAHWWNPGYFWLDTQLQGQVTSMRQALDEAQVRYYFRQYPGGRHNERAWAQRIDEPLKYLFGS
jgi:enterochelin esterase-like enzyme